MRGYRHDIDEVSIALLAAYFVTIFLLEKGFHKYGRFKIALFVIVLNIAAWQFFYSTEMRFLISTMLGSLSPLLFLKVGSSQYCKNKHGKMLQPNKFEIYFHNSKLAELQNKLEELKTSNQVDFDIEVYFPFFNKTYTEGFLNTCKLSVTRYKCNKCNYTCDLYEIFTMAAFDRVKDWKEFFGLKIPYSWRFYKSYEVKTEC